MINALLPSCPWLELLVSRIMIRDWRLKENRNSAGFSLGTCAVMLGLQRG